jgi:hypothetical protein
MAERVTSNKREATFLEELQSTLRIDQNALEDAAAQHPELFYRVASEYALTTSLRDQAKQDLSETEAKADSRIRHDIEVAGDKVTEKAVESAKLLDGQVTKARDRLMRLNQEVGEWSALKEAFQQRGYVLRDLVQLYLSRYYSDTENQSHRVREARAGHARRELNKERHK